MVVSDTFQHQGQHAQAELRLRLPHPRSWYEDDCLQVGIGIFSSVCLHQVQRLRLRLGRVLGLWSCVWHDHDNIS